MPKAGRTNPMPLLVFGTGAAIGLHVGLLHFIEVALSRVQARALRARLRW